MQPLSSRISNKGLMNSKEYEEFKKSVYLDVARLFDIANEHGDIIPMNMDVLLLENEYLRDKIAELESKFGDFKDNFDNLKNNVSVRKMTKSYYDPASTVSNVGTVGATVNAVDNTFGIASIPAKRTSKVYGVSVSGSTYLPADLDYALYESTTPLLGDGVTIPLITDELGGLTEVEDLNLKNALLPTQDSYWLRTSYQESSVNEVYAGIHVKIPFSVINSLYANSLVLRPCPEYSMTLLDIQYKNSAGNWNHLSTFPAEAISKLKKIKFLFEQVEFVEFFIYFKQSAKIIEASRNVFNYGMYEVGLYLEEYNLNSATVLTKFQINGQAFDKILTPVLIEATGTTDNVDPECTHRLFYGGTSDPREFNSSIVEADINTIFIETTLNLINGVSPNVSQIQINYTTK